MDSLWVCWVNTPILVTINKLLIARALRAFADGFVAVLLPVYLLALGFGTWEVGLLATMTMLGSALATLAVGAWGHRFHHATLLCGAAVLMAATGVLFAINSHFWPLLLIAFVGTLNPSSGDVSVFLPLEHTQLALAADGNARTVLFARYSLIGALFAAFGALAVTVPEAFSSAFGWSLLGGLRFMFIVYGAIGLIVLLLYKNLRQANTDKAFSASANPIVANPPAASLGASSAIVIRLAMLFSVDSFAGGLVVNALLALWLFQQFGMSVADAGQFFFWSGLCTALSQLAAPPLARRIGLLNTMVFTHIPASLCLIAAAFATRLDVVLGLLIIRSLLSQMDVPARSAFVMAVVTPEERAAAASFTLVPKSLAAAAGPSIGGALFAAGLFAAPLVACGVLKIAYDLTIWRSFKHLKT